MHGCTNCGLGRAVMYLRTKFAHDDVAREFFSRYPWMDRTRADNPNLLLALCRLPMLPVVWQSLRMRKRSHDTG